MMDTIHPKIFAGRYLLRSLTENPQSSEKGAITSAVGSVYTLERIEDAPRQAWK